MKFKAISRKVICSKNLIFKTYNGENPKSLHYTTVKLKYKSNRNLNLHIVKYDLDMILIRKWLFKINLEYSRIKALNDIEQQQKKNLRMLE